MDKYTGIGVACKKTVVRPTSSSFRKKQAHVCLVAADNSTIIMDVTASYPILVVSEKDSQTGGWGGTDVGRSSKTNKVKAGGGRIGATGRGGAG